MTLIRVKVNRCVYLPGHLLCCVYLQVMINNMSIFRKVERLGTDLTRDFEWCDISSGIGIK